MTLKMGRPQNLSAMRPCY
ncbi:hypothetical protein QTG54_013103 [Skeletonema marinoi]|uniref:Uncharacterized protein n=1 Tax=Skeletonema marinoi TaxID=267567 RepID=A0AAD8XYT0_9STRA|nr:hypothetical protein QTG54_013103 [Skeletonema marinoi]